MKKLVATSAILMSMTVLSSAHGEFEMETVSLMNALAECNSEFMSAMKGATILAASYQHDRPGESFTIETGINDVHYASLVITKLRREGTTSCQLSF
jgi:hypothetical protein